MTKITNAHLNEDLNAHLNKNLKEVQRLVKICWELIFDHLDRADFSPSMKDAFMYILIKYCDHHLFEREYLENL